MRERHLAFGRRWVYDDGNGHHTQLPEGQVKLRLWQSIWLEMLKGVLPGLRSLRSILSNVFINELFVHESYILNFDANILSVKYPQMGKTDFIN